MVKTPLIHIYTPNIRKVMKKEKMHPMLHEHHEKKAIKSPVAKKEKDGRIMERRPKKKTAKIKK